MLRQLRRRSLAALRREVEPVDPEAYARFVQAWHGIPGERRGLEALVEALGQLQGAALVASTLETEVLAAAPGHGYRPADLDELCTAGDVVWVGAGGARRQRRPGAAVLRRPAAAARRRRSSRAERPDGALHDAIRAQLEQRGASFWHQLRAAAPGATDAELLAALWDLVWAGEVTNDSLAPLRAMLGSKRALKAVGHAEPRPAATRAG